MSVGAHRDHGPRHIPTAVLTVSDTRTLESDTGGGLVVELLVGAGHSVTWRELVPDEPVAIADGIKRALADPGTRALIATGGTGVAPRDITPDAVEPLLERVVPGFGEIFRALSYEEIGPAAFMSRALAGLSGGKPVFVIPGSLPAVRLALEKLILPEIGHLIAEAARSK